MINITLDNLVDFPTYISFLEQYQNPKKAEFDAKLIKTNAKMLGLYSPCINQIAKQIVKKSFTYIIERFPQGIIHEADIILGKVLCIAYKRTKEFLSSKLIDFAKNIDNWAVCDSVITSMIVYEKEKDYWYNWVVLTQKSDYEFVNRIGLVLTLSKLKTLFQPESIFELFKVTTFMRFHFADLAAAWLVSAMFIIDFESTYDYMSQNYQKFGKNTALKALLKTRESYLPTEEQKNRLRVLAKAIKKDNFDRKNFLF